MSNFNPVRSLTDVCFDYYLLSTKYSIQINLFLQFIKTKTTEGCLCRSVKHKKKKNLYKHCSEKICNQYYRSCRPISYGLNGVECTAGCPQNKEKILFSKVSSNCSYKRSNFWHSDLSNIYASGCDYVLHLTCVMPIPGKMFQTTKLWRQTKQSNSKNHKCRTSLSINLTNTQKPQIYGSTCYANID